MAQIMMSHFMGVVMPKKKCVHSFTDAFFTMLVSGKKYFCATVHHVMAVWPWQKLSSKPGALPGVWDSFWGFRHLETNANSVGCYRLIKLQADNKNKSYCYAKLRASIVRAETISALPIDRWRFGSRHREGHVVNPWFHQIRVWPCSATAAGLIDSTLVYVLTSINPLFGNT